jgi:uncharacterized membrane protein YkoI
LGRLNLGTGEEEVVRIGLTATPVAVAATLLISGLSAAWAGNGTAVLAGLQSAAQTPPPVSELKDEQEGKAEIQAFENAKVSLADAISAAEKHTQGKAMDAAFADYNGAPAYEVKTFQNGAVWDGIIDADSGEMIGEGETTAESDLDRDDKAELAAFKTTKQTLLQALKAAEEHAGGKAIDGGLEEVDGKVVYEVEVVKNGKVETVDVNPENGEIVASHSPSSGPGR